MTITLTIEPGHIAVDVPRCTLTRPEALAAERLLFDLTDWMQKKCAPPGAQVHVTGRMLVIEKP